MNLLLEFELKKFFIFICILNISCTTLGNIDQNLFEFTQVILKNPNEYRHYLSASKFIKSDLSNSDQGIHNDSIVLNNFVSKYCNNEYNFIREKSLIGSSTDFRNNKIDTFCQVVYSCHNEIQEEDEQTELTETLLVITWIKKNDNWIYQGLSHGLY